MDATTALQTTLLLLYFVSPPVNGPKNEAKRIWTLQSTSQIQTPTPKACVVIGNQMIEEILPVSTMTVRAYCLCAHGDGNACVQSQDLQPFARAPNAEPRPTVQRLGPKTVVPSRPRN